MRISRSSLFRSSSTFRRFEGLTAKLVWNWNTTHASLFARAAGARHA